jgi:hypothetical protein
MATVRAMISSGASRQEIALKAGASHGHISQAIQILAEAPDLADQVEQGNLSLTDARRYAFARTLAQLDTPTAPPASH